MENIHPLLLLPPLLGGIILCAGTFATVHLDATLRRLNGELTSREDMALLRRTIRLNMTGALLVMILGAVYTVLSVGLFVAGMASLVLMNVYLFGIGILCGAFSRLYAKPIEQRAMSLPVGSGDPWVSETYRRWVEQWRKGFRPIS